MNKDLVFKIRQILNLIFINFDHDLFNLFFTEAVTWRHEVISADEEQ